MRLLPLALALSISLPVRVFASEATTVVVVRHAEKAKDEEQTDDPKLTPEGEARAQELARVLRSLPVRAIYSTRFRRTRLTAAPLAAAKKLDVQDYDAREPKALVSKILERHRGQATVVVGHSDSIPGMLAALGAQEVSLGLKDYDSLFVVILGQDRAMLLPLHYGAQNP